MKAALISHLAPPSKMKDISSAVGVELSTCPKSDHLPGHPYQGSTWGHKGSISSLQLNTKNMPVLELPMRSLEAFFGPLLGLNFPFCFLFVHKNQYQNHSQKHSQINLYVFILQSASQEAQSATVGIGEKQMPT
jgi:hypothetical protein